MAPCGPKALILPIIVKKKSSLKRVFGESDVTQVWCSFRCKAAVVLKVPWDCCWVCSDCRAGRLQRVYKQRRENGDDSDAVRAHQDGELTYVSRGSALFCSFYCQQDFFLFITQLLHNPLAITEAYSKETETVPLKLPSSNLFPLSQQRDVGRCAHLFR